MKNFMNSIQVPKVGRNAHDHSHTVALTGKFGFLYPTLCKEVLPGQTTKLRCEHLLRFMPLVNPVMHKFWVTTHYYFVPNRLCWANWEKFITHTPDGTQPAHPYVNVGGLILTEPFYPPLADYMGVPKPPGSPTDIQIQVDAMPFMAYQKCWFEFYRDQNNIDLSNPVNNVGETLEDGDNTTNVGWLWQLRKRAWNHDYFTSCLPEPQAGPAIQIPMATSDLNVYQNTLPAAQDITWDSLQGGITPTTSTVISSNSDLIAEDHLFIAGSELAEQGPLVEELRRASAIQRFMEKLIRGGRRYAEVIRSFFGAKPQDSRLQRPEYITGIKSPVIISEVLNTTGTDDLPQGNMSGHGISVAGGGYGDTYTAHEHGWIIGITSIMPDSAYENGLPRHLSNKTYTDYFWPEFANLGEEAVLNQEIFAYQANRAETFGYLPRYSRYRTDFNRVCGQMRFGESLETWTFGRQFTTPPALNQEFIECTPGKRIFADTAEEDDELVVFVQHDILVLSPVPKFGTPTLY